VSLLTNVWPKYTKTITPRKRLRKKATNKYIHAMDL
jgi:hypothetical protein